MRNLRPLAARLAGDRGSRQFRLAPLHDEDVLERIPQPFDVGRRRLLVLVPHIVAEDVARGAGPGVGERTIESPFGVTGECMRQNGASMLWSVSVVPWVP